MLFLDNSNYSNIFANGFQVRNGLIIQRTAHFWVSHIPTKLSLPDGFYLPSDIAAHFGVVSFSSSEAIINDTTYLYFNSLPGGFPATGPSITDWHPTFLPVDATTLLLDLESTFPDFRLSLSSMSDYLTLFTEPSGGLLFHSYAFSSDSASPLETALALKGFSVSDGSEFYMLFHGSMAPLSRKSLLSPKA